MILLAEFYRDEGLSLTGAEGGLLISLLLCGLLTQLKQGEGNKGAFWRVLVAPLVISLLAILSQPSEWELTKLMSVLLGVSCYLLLSLEELRRDALVLTLRPDRGVILHESALKEAQRSLSARLFERLRSLSPPSRLALLWCVSAPIAQRLALPPNVAAEAWLDYRLSFPYLLFTLLTALALLKGALKSHEHASVEALNAQKKRHLMATLTLTALCALLAWRSHL